jgi:hypothetical protein
MRLENARIGGDTVAGRTGRTRVAHSSIFGKPGFARCLLGGLAVLASAASAASAANAANAAGAERGVCPDDAIVNAAHALHFAGDADFWTESMAATCRLDPDNPKHAFVALTYLPGEERSGTPQRDSGAYTRDLDVLVLDLSDATLLAHRHFPESIDDGGDRFEGVSIDTGRYFLARGKRAFGVRVLNATHCTCANSRHTNLTLFLRDGKELVPLLETDVSSAQAGYEQGTEQPAACEAIATQSHSVLAVGSGTSHGLADLQLTETQTPSYDFEEDTARCPPLERSQQTTTLHYDGQAYK